jgi:osmotically inducible protein OsmC
VTKGEVPQIDEETFFKYANDAKVGCPVSQALSATPIELEASLV